MKRIAFALVLSTISAASQATVIFSDDFAANSLGLNSAPAGWAAIGGTVDTIGPGLFGELCAGSGTCIDLDGSTGAAGVLSRSFGLVAGTTYTLAFDIAGNRRGAGTESGVVSFGTATLAYSLADTQTAYLPQTLAFTPSASGSYALSFANAGGDNLGAILDNVSITAVPEPGTWALLAAGLAVVGSLSRRRAG